MNSVSEKMKTNSASMDKLPEPLFLEILSRFDDLVDVSRCLIASKTFKTAYPHLRSITHQCTLKRYLDSRPGTVSSSSQAAITPFKTVFVNMVSRLEVVETIRIGIDDELLDLSYRDGEGEDDQADDLHLTDGEFVKLWLPRVSGGMKLLSISDFWLQACRRRSVVLSLVSSYCRNLLELEVKNAWLSVENVSPMPMLTSLTLESVKLDDKRLVKLNECFPNLKVLYLINVSGVKAPCIHLLSLKTCHWTVPDSLSSLTLITPNLSTLRLECTKSPRLNVEAPKLFHIHLDIERRNFEIKKFENLKTVWLKSRNIGALFDTFELAETVENLTVDTRDWPRGATGSCNFTIKRVFTVFPNLSSLCIKSNVWSGFEACYKPLYWEAWDVRKALKTFSAYLLLEVDPSMTFACVSGVLDGCMGVSQVSLLIHGDVDSSVSKSFISRCMTCCRPGLNWKWGIWREGMEDSWITDIDHL